MICVVPIKIQWNPRLKCFALKGQRDANQPFMHCLEISIEIILFEEFCEHKWSDKKLSMSCPAALESWGNIGFCKWSLENASRLPPG